MQTLCNAADCRQDAIITIESAFDAHFVVWTRRADAWRLDTRGISTVEWADTELLLRMQKSGTRWQVLPRAESEHLVILQLPDDRYTSFGVGIVQAESRRWVERVAAVTAENLDQRAERHQQQLTLDSLAEQVSESFEELSLLRGLASYLECCEVEKPMREVAEVLLPRLREVLKAEAVALVPAGPPSGGDDHELTETLRTGSWPIDEEQCRHLVEQLAEPGPVVRNGLQRVPGFETFAGVQACLIVPVAEREKNIGWLIALNKVVSERDSRVLELGREEFGTIEAGLLGAAATLLSTHARNARLYHQLERLVTGVVRSLINTIDAKDSYTCGHSDRVAAMSKRLAEGLGLDRQECNHIYLAGLLHDIGKIGVPDEVLLKSGKLTDEEFALIKRHPVIGYEILKPLKELSYALPGILHHHESFDGHGYPHGLAGEEIPLMARILAVADAYDAMTSCRPYREAMPVQKAESILRKGAARQWDQRIIDVFFEHAEEMRRICRSQSPLPVLIGQPANEWTAEAVSDTRA